MDTWWVVYHADFKYGSQKIAVLAASHEDAYKRAYKKLKAKEEIGSFHILSTEKAS